MKTCLKLLYNEDPFVRGHLLERSFYYKGHYKQGAFWEGIYLEETFI